MSNGLTEAKIIAERIEGAYSRSKMDMIFAEQVFAYGGDAQQNWGSSAGSGGIFKIYPDITAGIKEIGRSKRTLKAATVARSRLMSAEPQPEFEGLTQEEAEIRQAIWRARYRGNHDNWGSIHDQSCDAWLDGWMHGVGTIQLQLATNRDTGLQKTVATHIPVTQVIWDSTERNPKRANWVAVVKVLPAEVAEALYGSEHVRPHVFQRAMEGNTRTVAVVLVTEYFDLGYGGDEPSMAVVIGDIRNKPVKVGKNKFGQMLPVAHMVNLLLPGMMSPVGQVALQRQVEEALNRIHTFMMQVWKTGAGRQAVDISMIEPDQVDLMRSGDPNAMIEFNGRDGKGDPIRNIPGAQIPNLTLDLYKLFEAEFGQQAGLSEIDRGQAPDRQRTAFEISQQQAAVQQNRSGAAAATLAYTRDLMEKFYRVAAMYDKDPFHAMVMGEQIYFNDPEEPNSQLHMMLAKPANIVIGTESLTANDSEYQRERKLAMLDHMMKVVGAPGGIAVEAFTRALLETMGIPNPDDYMMQAKSGNPDPMLDAMGGQMAAIGAAQAGAPRGMTEPGMAGGQQ